MLNSKTSNASTRWQTLLAGYMLLQLLLLNVVNGYQMIENTGTMMHCIKNVCFPSFLGLCTYLKTTAAIFSQFCNASTVSSNCLNLMHPILCAPTVMTTSYLPVCNKFIQFISMCSVPCNQSQKTKQQNTQKFHVQAFLENCTQAIYDLFWFLFSRVEKEVRVVLTI